MKSEFERQIDEWRNHLESPEKLAEETIICECFCVSVGDIRSMFKTKQDFNLELLVEKFNFSNGCKSCLKNLNKDIDKIFN